MPIESQPPQKRRRLPFNPPRPRASPSAGPSSSSTAPKPSTSTKPRKSTSNGHGHQHPQQSGTPSPSPSPSVSQSPNPEGEPEEEPEPDYILAEITTRPQDQHSDILSSAPTIPRKLLTRLLHQHFRNPKTKIALDANDVVAKYVDVFVREALARAAFERNESGDGLGEGGRGDGFLEVCYFLFLLCLDVGLVID